MFFISSRKDAKHAKDSFIFFSISLSLLFLYFKSPILKLLTPAGNINVTQHNSFWVTLNITCIKRDCGNITVSLDPMQRCDCEGTHACSVCGNIFLNTTPAWNYDDGTLFGVGDLCYSTADFITIYGSINDNMCTNTYNLNGSDADCALYTENGGSSAYVCPSYDRLLKPVTIVDCISSGNTSNYSQPINTVFNFSSDYFTGNNSKGTRGLISTNTSATPFYTNQTSNPYTILLSKNTSQIVKFWINATGQINTIWNFFAEAKDTNIFGIELSAKTPYWNVTIQGPGPVNLNLIINLLTQNTSMKTIQIYDSNTKTIIKQNTTNASNITYTLPAGIYDLHLYTYGSDLSAKFYKISLTKNTTYYAYIDKPATSPRGLITYTLDTDINMTSADVLLSYNGTSYTNENRLYIEKCNNWNRTNKTCPGNWRKQQTTINKTAKTASCTVNSFSGFAVLQGAAPGGTGGGGGGSARRAYQKIIQEQKNITNTNWSTFSTYKQTNKKTKETQETTEQEKPKATVPAPEIKTEKQTPETEKTTLQYLPSTKALLPGILAVAALFGAIAYLTLIKSPTQKQPTHKPSRKKDNIELEKHGFKVKK